MTAVTHRPSRRLADRPISERLVFAALILGLTALTLALNAGAVDETLKGGFADPDDAMRLVQVRAWLAGQSWFDLTATRLDPPHGSFMHWSRLVDLPAAALIRVFDIATDQGHAERLMAVVLPTLWLVALFWGVARLAMILLGRAGRLPALLGLCASGTTLVQVAPGRIGHHGPETVILVLTVGCALAALDPRRARQGFACGLLVAISLALSLETLPFDAVLAASLFGLWVWRGPTLAATLAWFGAGLLVALPLLFLVTVGPGRWGAQVCDAYGAAHLGAGVIGGAGAVVLGLTSRHGQGRILRLLAASGTAALAVAYVAFFDPACLHSPFAGVDPLVRDLWLRHVVESLPLPVFIEERPMIGLAIVMPLVLGLLGSLVALTLIGRQPGALKTRVGVIAILRLLLVAALSTAALALAFWQVRVLASVTPIALCGAVAFMTRLADELGRTGHRRAAACAPLAIFAFASTTWLLILPEDARSPAAVAAATAKSACLAPEAFTPLRTLPPGTIVAPIDSGSHVLEATSLDVFAAPYHRNDDGNRFAFDVFLAAPTAARDLLVSRHVTYVAICPGIADIARLVARASDGLASRLAQGQFPDFLTPVPLAGTPYRVFAVRPAPR